MERPGYETERERVNEMKMTEKEGKKVKVKERG